MAELFCGVDDSTFTQKDCGIDLGGIVAIGFLDQDTPSPSETDLETTSYWTTKTATSPPTAFIVQDTRGEYSGGSAVEGEGFGKTGSQMQGQEHEVTVEVEGMKDNRNFWEDKLRRKYKFAFVTAGDDLYYVDTPVTIHATPTIARDVNEGVFWTVTIKWSSLSNPYISDKPDDVFD
jgi:hypothetical protein